MTAAQVVFHFFWVAGPWALGAAAGVWGTLTLVGVAGSWISQRAGVADAALLIGLRTIALLGLTLWAGAWLAAWLVRYGMAALAWLPVIGGGGAGPLVVP
ncbi:MAG: hypothetical protein KGO50_02400 [Myxococcales bacterium]|jgi:hypothetical protein|nr:hypothetical protein [Myxococcales bacterium]